MRQTKHIGVAGVTILIVLLGAGCENAVMTPYPITEQSSQPTSAEPSTPQAESIESETEPSASTEDSSSASASTEDSSSASATQAPESGSPVPELEPDTQELQTNINIEDPSPATSVTPKITQVSPLATLDETSREEKDAFLTLLYHVVNTISVPKKPDYISRITETNKIAFSLYGYVFDYLITPDYPEIFEEKIESFILTSVISRVKDYLQKIDEEFKPGVKEVRKE